MSRERIALFPLRTVLFPQALLPLRIFETRYVDMVRRCLREATGFGVVLIRDGGETGPVGALATVGTFARIVDFGSLPDGLLSIVAQGERRFRLVGHEMQRDGLHLGEVEWLDDPLEPPLTTREFAALRGILCEVLREVGDSYPAGHPRLDDAAWVAGHLSQLLPAPAAFRQHLLEAEGARARLALLDAARADE